MVLIMWIAKMSGGELSSPDVLHSEYSNAAIYGKIYQCEYKEENLILYLKQAVLSDDSQNRKINHIRITCDPECGEYQVSDYVCVTGDLKSIKGATNPGQFDSRTYYNAQKVSYTMWKPQIRLVERPDISLLRGLNRLKCILSKQYDQILPNQYGALLKGITLGNKTDISDEIESLFQVGGISHILAISALHLQILGDSIYKLLRNFRMPIGAAAMISGGLLIGYGILTGASVATLRALIMFLIRIGGDMTGRTYDRATGMAVAAVVLTAGNPSYLQYSGFWLSFFAVCSFLIFKERRKLAGGILLYLFMAPVMLTYFYEVSPYSIFLNLMVVPTVGTVLVFGILGCLGSIGSLFLGKVLVFPAVSLLHIYKILCELCEMLPGHTLLYGKPGWIQMILYYGILGSALYFFRKNRLGKIRFTGYLFMIAAWFLLTYRGITGIQVTMLDVGQGDSLIVETENGNTYLIDGGSTSEEEVGKYRILPYLKYRGIDQIEAVFLSHADKDHMDGILELLEMIKDKKTQLQICKIVLPDWKDISAFSEIVRLADECKIDVCRFDKGGTMVDGELIFSCLHPDGEDCHNNINEGSMILRLDYKQFSMLFTGDLEGTAETGLLGTYGDIDVLKVAHHGSKYSTSEAFLQEIQPEIGLISCGENNWYGHPHEELLQRLEAANAQVFQTPLHGAVTIRSNGERIDLKTFNKYNES